MVVLSWLRQLWNPVGGKSIPGNMFFGVKANPKTTPENKRQLIVTTEILKDANQGHKISSSYINYQKTRW